MEESRLDGKGERRDTMHGRPKKADNYMEERG
jgi:hypothetical protein